MKKIMLLLSVSSLLISCSGMSASQSTPAVVTEEKKDSVEICYLGAKEDNTQCLATQPIDAVKMGYLNPFTDAHFLGTGSKAQYRLPQRAVLLKDYSQQLKLAPNFILGELMALHKDTVGIYSPFVLGVLQKIRTLSQAIVKVNSSFRSPQYNAGLQGTAKWSRHQYGDAFDISSSKLSLNQLIQMCKDLGATYTDKYVAHVHCDWRNEPLAPAFFGSAPKTREMFDLPELVQDLNQSSEIQIEGIIRNGNVIQLSSAVEFQEDPTALYKKWQIRTPSGRLLEYESQSCQVLLESGVYYVSHFIGEHIHLQTSFRVK